MNIKDLASLLEQRNINIALNEESYNFPVLKFEIKTIAFHFFYREDFVRRSKFHKRYHSFLEISVKEESELLILKNKIEDLFSCINCVDGKKLYLRISTIDAEEMNSFIKKLCSDLFQ